MAIRHLHAPRRGARRIAMAHDRNGQWRHALLPPVPDRLHNPARHPPEPVAPLPTSRSASPTSAIGQEPVRTTTARRTAQLLFPQAVSCARTAPRAPGGGSSPPPPCPSRPLASQGGPCRVVVGAGLGALARRRRSENPSTIVDPATRVIFRFPRSLSPMAMSVCPSQHVLRGASRPITGEGRYLAAGVGVCGPPGPAFRSVGPGSRPVLPAPALGPALARFQAVSIGGSSLRSPGRPEGLEAARRPRFGPASMLGVGFPGDCCAFRFALLKLR